MPVVTRFNPSCNAALHLGHLYTILVNEHYAHSRGGTFIVRFDDSHPIYRQTMGDRIHRVRYEMREDIEWLGIAVDEWHSQQEWMPRVEEELVRIGFHPPASRFDDMGPECVAKRTQEFYRPWPYDPRLTTEHVILDHLMGVTDVIRGDDLITEYCLYYWFCEQFGYPKPKHIYLPRVRGPGGDLSKSAGSKVIGEYRALGYSPEALKRAVLEGAVLHPIQGWDIQFLLSEPRVSL